MRPCAKCRERTRGHSEIGHFCEECNEELNRPDEYQNKILDLHLLFLEKMDNMSKGERESFSNYLYHLGKPVIRINRR